MTAWRAVVAMSPMRPSHMAALLAANLALSLTCLWLHVPNWANLLASFLAVAGASWQSQSE